MNNMDEEFDYIGDAMDTEFFSNSARSNYQRYDPFQFYGDGEFLQNSYFRSNFKILSICKCSSRDFVILAP